MSLHLKVLLYDPSFLTNSTRAGYLNVLKPTFGSVFLKSVGTKSSCNSNLFVINSTNVMCLGPSNDPMWENSRSIYIGVTAASPFGYFFTRFRANLLVHMRSEHRWRLNLKCSTATRIMRKFFALELLSSLPCEIVVVLKNQEQCASWLAFSTRAPLKMLAINS